MVRPVDAIRMPVLSATRLMVHKLLSFSQHYCDFARGLPLARSCASRSTGTGYARRPRHSPYAEAFLMLLDRLDVVPGGTPVPYARSPRRGRPRDEHSAGPPDEYVEAEIQRLLTEDPDVAEQGITVVRREHGLVLTGEVESAAPTGGDPASGGRATSRTRRSPATSG